MTTFLIILNLFIAGVALALTLFLILSQGRDKQRILFASLTFTAAVWILSNYFGSNVLNSLTHYLILADFISGAMLASLFWLFTREMRLNALETGRKPRSWKVVLAVSSTIFVIGLVLAGHIVDITVGSELIIDTKPLYPVYPIVILSMVFLGIKDLIVAQLRSRKSAHKMRLRLVLIGLLIAFIGIAAPNLILENIIPKGDVLTLAYNTSYAGILFFLILSTYAIVRHGLFDIKLAAVRSAAYIFSLLTLSIIYYLLAYIVSVTLFQGETTTVVSVSPINIALALVLAFIFQPVKLFFDKLTNDIFYRDRYDTNEFYARLSKILTTRADLRGLLQQTAREIGKTLKSEQAFFFVRYGEHKHTIAGTAHHTDLPIRDVELLDGYVIQKGDKVIVAELLSEKDDLRRLLVSHKIALLMPLMREEEILGYLALGDQRSSGYTKRDLGVLGTISDELVIGIQNALSVQEIKDINAHLQQRINAATAELRTTNARLKRIDAVKDEFLSMASHQLRTPLTSIKGYLSMVLEEDLGKVPKNQRQVLEEAYTSSERMVHLIHDFLNVSRLQTGKFVLEKEDYDISKLVAEEVRSLERVAQSRNMKLKLIDTLNGKMLSIDTNKVRQVVMNFIDNAIFYSHPDTTITIKLAKKSEEIVLEVLDTGIGVPKDEQAQLFSKFYRATNARKQRPDGTGVGLFLSKKVIVAHGGDTIFESKEGKGSTFGFWLPLEKS